MAKIALSLSGGGFRAATYHLGVLSYLNHLKTKDGTTLLDQVSAVSTISGGTLTGLWFILRKSQGWSNERMLGELYVPAADDKRRLRTGLPRIPEFRNSVSNLMYPLCNK